MPRISFFRRPFIVVLSALTLPLVAHAQSKAYSTFQSSLNTAGSLGFGATAGDPAVVIANGINAVLGACGIVLIGFIVYAGILYMQAGSDPKNATKAKGIIINSVIGIIIIVAAYAIASFVLQALSGVVNPTGK